MILDSLQLILLFGIFGFITNWLAWKKGFYKLPLTKSIPVNVKQIGGIFAIYLGTIFFLSPWISYLFIYLSQITPPSLAALNVIQVIIILGLMLALFLFCRSYAKEVVKKAWKDFTAPNSESISSDLFMGFWMWFLSFPIVSVIGQFFDLMLYFFYGLENSEQVAVRYLKDSLSSPSQIFLALFMIVILAPVLEEFLFRGSLQNFFKNHLGTKGAILLSAFCFSMFHFSSSQGVGNISLIISLFTFGCFLGFIYEKRSSLFASIGLHATFNLISSLRVLFFQEG